MCDFDRRMNENPARVWEKACRVPEGTLDRVQPSRTDHVGNRYTDFALQQMWDGAGAGDPAPYVVLEPEPKEP